DPRVRFQVALTLGDWYFEASGSDANLLPPLAKILLAGANDKWTRYAVYSSLPHPHSAGALLDKIVSSTKALSAKETGSWLTIIRELATLVGARSEQEEVSQTLHTIVAPTIKIEGPFWRFVALQGLAEGMGQRGKQLGVVLNGLPKKHQTVVQETKQLLAKAA